MKIRTIVRKHLVETFGIYSFSLYSDRVKCKNKDSWSRLKIEMNWNNIDRLRLICDLRKKIIKHSNQTFHQIRLAETDSTRSDIVIEFEATPVSHVRKD